MPTQSQSLRLEEVVVSSNAQKQTQKGKQSKETGKKKPTIKSQEKNLEEKDIIYLPDKQFKIIDIKMFIKLVRLDQHSENLNKETANIRKCQTEVTTKEHNK